MWRSVLGEFELAEHERLLLDQACRVADICGQLQALVTEDGPLVESRLGESRANPALVELRQQRQLLARLIVALRVPIGDQEEVSRPGAGRSQYRGPRGVYGLGGVG